MKNWRMILMFAAFAGLMWYIFGRMIYAFFDDRSKSTYISVPEYNNLFTKEAKSKLEFVGTTVSRNRPPESSYIYNGDLDIFIYKVKLSSSWGLNKLIAYEKSTNISANGIYTNIPSYKFEFEMKTGKPPINISSVHFTFNGDSITSIVKNDSVYCYYYKFKSFGIAYNSESYEIIAKADKSNLPGSVAFIKKGNFLYIILMSMNRFGTVIQPDLLYSIINK